MANKWLWVAVSALVAVSMVAASCQPSAVTPGETTTTATAGTTAATAGTTAATAAKTTTTAAKTGEYPVAVPVGQLPPTPAGAKMVVNSVGKLMEEPRYGGTMTIAATFGPWSGLDPIRWTGDGTQWFLAGVYEKLALGDYTKSIPGTGEWVSTPGEPTSWHWVVRLKDVRPHLAESWERSPDLLTTTIRIRKGIRWQNKPPVNGREFTAYDVKYVFDRHWGTGSGFTKPDTRYAGFIGGATNIVSIECPDKYTVVFKWKNPDVNQLNTLLGIPSTHPASFYPREILDTYGPTGLENWRNVIGTGAFILQDYVADSSFNMVKNPDYWCKDELLPGNKLPYVDKVNFIIIPDRSVNIAAFRVGKMDFGAALYMSVEEVEQLQKTNPYVYYTYYPSETNTLIYPKMEVPPFNDIRVRKALQMAIDLDEYRRIYPGPRIEQITMPIMPPLGKDYYIPFEKLPADIQDNYKYNPEKAKQLLAEAGYPNGFKTEVAVWPGDVVTPIVGNMWAKIGVELTIRTVEAVALSTQLSGRTYSQMIAFTGHWAYVGSGLWQHLPGYYFPTKDEKLIAIVTEMYTKRALLGDDNPDVIKLNQQAQEIILRDVYYFAVPPGRMTAQPHHPWVKNRWSYFPIDDHILDLVARMWIDQDLRYKMIGKR